jgi:hypothetical protein
VEEVFQMSVHIPDFGVSERTILAFFSEGIRSEKRY